MSDRSYNILITGASSGFGALTARHLSFAGHHVFASMKSHNEEANKSIESFVAQNKCNLKPLVLDVTSQSSCDQAINMIIKEVEHLDVVIHNAGHMGYGPAEAFSPQQYLDYYDINCVGPQRVNQAVLPHMRARKAGLFLWVGSTSTRGGTPPFLAPYFAAKAGMDSLAVSYSTELTRWGIETSIVVPGAFTKGTNHFASAGKPEMQNINEQYFGPGQPYEGMSEQIMERLASLEPSWANVEDIAKEIVRIVGMETGTRPFRVHIDPSDDGAKVVNGVADLARREYYGRLGLTALLHVSGEGISS